MPGADPAGHSLAGELELIEDAAREAGEIAMRYFRADPEVWWKGGKSPVSEADILVDRYLREVLLRARPEHGWLSEETVDDAARLAARRTFVVDPIDGTRAFIDGRTTWCISIAVVEEGRALVGVLDCPAVGEIYSASAGGGARLNGRPIRVKAPEEALVVAGPKNMIQAMPEPLRARVAPHAYIPSLAYRLAMVARGALDATFVKPDSYDWDLAAADLIVHEAGGAVADPSGRAPRYAGPDPRHGALAAGSGPLLEKMVGVIAEIGG